MNPVRIGLPAERQVASFARVELAAAALPVRVLSVVMALPGKAERRIFGVLPLYRVQIRTVSRGLGSKLRRGSKGLTQQPGRGSFSR